MPKQPPKPKLNYSLRRRFFNEINQPLEWIDYGQGQFTDLETVQKQIKMLAGTSRRVEIEFIYNGTLRGFDGSITGKTIIYEKR